jgi:hypothetical protein
MAADLNSLVLACDLSVLAKALRSELKICNEYLPSASTISRPRGA